MDRQDQVSALLQRLHAANPGGFAIALHIRFTSPTYLFQSYDKAWIDEYNRDGLLLHDPTVRWGFAHEGHVRWSELAPTDEAGVLGRAAGHGLRYGVCIALQEGATRSIASFARRDRELTEDEIRDNTGALRALHELTATAQTFSPRMHNLLKQMSIYFTHA
ncbi:autoinducer binding domain-containing protein [Albidovulum sp.]